MMHYTFFLFGLCSSLANAECTCPYGTPSKTTSQGCIQSPSTKCCPLSGGVVCASCEADFILFRPNSICYAKTCTCPNGTPTPTVVASPFDRRCPVVDGKTCESCDPGYVLNTEKTACFPSTCTCANGTPADSVDGVCPVEDGQKCKSCDDGYTLNTEQTACIENQCTCDNGTGASGTQCSEQGAQKCASCDKGYTPNSENTACVIRADCTCPNGTPATDSTCSSSADGKACAKCNQGYTLNSESTACIKNQCTCDNGTGASGTQCSEQGEQKCVKCKAGFVLYTDSFKCLAPNGSHCSANDQCKSGTCLESINGSHKCVCNDNCIYEGPIVAPQTIVSSEAACKRKCSQSDLNAAAYSFSSSNECRCLQTSALPKLNTSYVSGLVTEDCTCEYGDASVEQCPVEHPINCTKCKTGYFLKNQQCFLKICKCPYGTPAEGTDCPELDAQQCTSCDSGFKLNGDKSQCVKSSVEEILV